MWHPDPDLLALAALPAERRDPGVEAHLAGCPLCRQHVESLRRTVDLALSGTGDVFDPADEDRPPPRIWRAITDELEIVPDEPAPLAPPAAPRRAGRAWRRLAVPVAAAVAGVAAGLGIGVLATPAAPEATVVARLGPLDGTAATGTVAALDRAGGRNLQVHLDDVTDTAGADYLEVWLMDPAGTRLVSLGSLARDGAGFRGEFTVPAGVPAEFDTVDVSAEKWDGDPAHSRVSLLRGALA